MNVAVNQEQKKSTTPVKPPVATDLLQQMTNAAKTPEPEVEKTPFEKDVLALFQRKKHGNLGKYMYDSAQAGDDINVKRGAALWDDFLGSTEHYYLLHEEAALLGTKGGQIARLIENATDHPLHVVDLGPGSKRSVESKTIPLMKEFKRVAAYTALDISSDLALTSTNMVRERMPKLDVNAFTIDFFNGKLTNLLSAINDNDKNAALVQMFLGGTAGNFSTEHPPEFPTPQLLDLLRNFKTAAQPDRDSFLVISHDSNQDETSLLKAYSEPANAEFALNVLQKIRNELPTTGFKPDNFEYKPEWDPNISLLSHNAVAKRTHTFKIGREEIRVQKGQKFALIHSFKYSIGAFQKHALDAGYTIIGTVVSDQRRIAAHVLRA